MVVSTHTKTIRDVEQYHWRISESEIPRQAFTNPSNLSLAAALELAAIENHVANSTDGNETFIRLPNCPIWQLIHSANWPNRRKPAKFTAGNISLIVLPKTQDIWWTQHSQSLQRELQSKGFGVNLARALTAAVMEMVDNIWIHSAADHSGLLAYEIRNRRFAFSITDLGVGVLTSLRRNPEHRYLTSSMQALEKAVQPGVSGQQDGTGLGFYTLLSALADLWGTARLRSGEAAMVIDHKSDQRKTDFHYLPYLPGLHVAVLCGLNIP